MKTKLLDAVESKSLKKETPHFEVGDTVDVHCRIQEGDKTRTQIFTGTVIARKGRGINESFIVRRIVGNEGVERQFPLHSPNVLDIVADPQRQSPPGQAVFPPQEDGQGRQAFAAAQRAHAPSNRLFDDLLFTIWGSSAALNAGRRRPNSK